jgi:transcriptional regulator with XRE-family HTH domain
VPNERLRQALRDKRWTAADLAARIDVDPKTVQRWISTGRPPLARHQDAAADQLGVPAAELFPTDAAPSDHRDAAPWHRRPARVGVDHYCDPTAPPPNTLWPQASAIATDAYGSVVVTRPLLHEEWRLPAADMQPGEHISETAVRAVWVATGFDVEPDYIVGVYTDPLHVTAYPDGQTRQQCSVCFACRIIGGTLAPGPNSHAAVIQKAELFTTRPTFRDPDFLRIRHWLDGTTPWFQPLHELP